MTPLAAGGVHRPALIVLELAALAGIVLLFGSALARRQTLRTGAIVALPLFFVLIPCIQSIPLPSRVRAAVDPNGSAILAEGVLAPDSKAPLSLDPPATRGRIGEAAAALALFIAAFHLASGQRRRHLFPRVLGVAATVAVVVGLGHRLFGISKIYGLLSTSTRTLVIGPFVNPNHSAEFMSLGAFVCLACSFQRPTMLNRVGWLVATGLCLGGSVATLSRGGAVALAAGVVVFVFLRAMARDTEGEPHASSGRHRASLAWGGLLLGLALLAAAAFGANDLISRFHTDHVDHDIRLRVWKDSLQIIKAHPFGIGRGAFDRVFPVYRTIKTNFPVRFAFVENTPLQLLIDAGWLMFGVCLAGLCWAAWLLVRRGRRDPVEAGLVAGIVAVLVQNFVDFGLEIPGVLLPFAAILGTVFGRMRQPEESDPQWRGWPLAAVTCVGLIVGLGSVAHSSYDNFDALLARPGNLQRAQLLERAQRAHPMDYYYVLAYARLLPLRAPTGPSPRFHALNRALQLCPSCEQVHTEVARNLWRLGLRRQALQEWRTAISLQPVLLLPALGELHAGGARATDLASVASSDPTLLVQVAHYLAALSRPDQGLVVLDQAEALGVSPKDLLLTRAELQLFNHDESAAAATVAKARRADLRSPQLDVLEARLTLSSNQAAGADEALAILDRAATQFPQDVGVQRARLGLVTKYQKWRAAERSLDGFKRALSMAGGSAGEAHVAAARLDAKLSRWASAIDEYRIALADTPEDISLWIEFGQAALVAGRNTTAREAFVTANHLSPNNPEIAKALQELDAQAHPATTAPSGNRSSPELWLAH